MSQQILKNDVLAACKYEVSTSVSQYLNDKLPEMVYLPGMLSGEDLQKDSESDNG